MPDDDANPDRKLTEKIRELESLLEARDKTPRRPAAGRPANIPILDEVVEPAPKEAGSGSLPTDISDLAERLEEKFAMELDQIIRILKGNLKTSIARELRARLSERDEGGSEES